MDPENIDAESGHEGETPASPDVSANGNAGAGPDPLDQAISEALDGAGKEHSIEGWEAAAKPGGNEPVDRPQAVEDARRPSNDQPANAAAAAEPKPGDGRAPGEAMPSDVSASPEHWPAERRQAFEKLPAEAQGVVLGLAKDLEAGFTRKSMEYAQDRTFAEAIRGQIGDEERMQLREAGIDEVEGVRRLVALNRWATRDLPNYVQYLVARGSLQPAQVFPQLATRGNAPAVNHGQQPQPQAPANPAWRAPTGFEQHPTGGNGRAQPGQPPATPHAQPSPLNGEVEARLSQLEMQPIDLAIRRFVAAKDQAGNAAHPHFDAVKAAIPSILQNPDLQAEFPDPYDRLTAAYDRACWATPSIRDQLLSAEAEKRATAQVNASDVGRARRARPAVNPSPNAGRPAPPPPGNLDDVIDNAISKAMPGGI